MVRAIPRSYWVTAAIVAWQMGLIALQHIGQDSPWSVLSTPFIVLSMVCAGLGAIVSHKAPRPGEWDGVNRRSRKATNPADKKGVE